MPMQDDEIVLSPAKYKELEEELEHLSTVGRREIRERLDIARSLGDLSENFVRELLPGDLTDEAAALASIRRLKEEAERTGTELFLGHDQAFIQTVRLCPEFYD